MGPAYRKCCKGLSRVSGVIALPCHVLSVGVCMYVCMYVCMHACMHACVYVCMHACMCVCVYACMHACVYVCLYACRHVCMYICMCVRILICMYVGTFTSSSIYSPIYPSLSLSVCIQTDRHMHTCTHICTYTYTSWSRPRCIVQQHTCLYATSPQPTDIAKPQTHPPELNPHHRR